jgi:hypothetical protein
MSQSDAMGHQCHFEPARATSGLLPIPDMLLRRGRPDLVARLAGRCSRQFGESGELRRPDVQGPALRPKSNRGLVVVTPDVYRDCEAVFMDRQRTSSTA